MKKFIIALVVLLGVAGQSIAQRAPIPSAIYIIDQQSGAQVLATSDAAMAFKNAFIALVVNTYTAKVQQAIKIGPGKRSFLIQQLKPDENGNAYQLSMQRTFLGQANVVYTFLYNVDQNKLYFFNPNIQNWAEETVQGDNIINLNNCQTFGVFNEPQAQPQPAATADAQQGPAPDATDNTPVDNDVSAPAAPPALPEYDQPECPQDGYLWQPGYWGYNTEVGNYYWVPGVWVAPPSDGLLWTPPYWGFEGGVYAFHAGYWGNTIGFYGGIAYGFGYEGVGFVGGDWVGGHFRYNTAVLRVGANVHNVYVDARVIHRVNVRSHASFNGPGGSLSKPNAKELEASKERHIAATADQIRNQRAARADKAQMAGAGGKPGNLAGQKAPEKIAANTGGMKPGTAGTGGIKTGTPGTGGMKTGTPGTGGMKTGTAGTTGVKTGPKTGMPPGPGGKGKLPAVPKGNKVTTKPLLPKPKPKT